MSGTDYTQTPNLGLYKPLPTADIDGWGAHLNTNADTLDALLAGAVSGTVDADFGLFVGIADPGMRAGGAARTWVGLSDNGYMTYYDTQSLASFIAPPGYPLGLAASVRSSDNMQPGGGTANIAIGAFAKSDISDPNAGITWAFYGTSRKYPNAATTIGMELSVGCVGQGATECNPYQTGGGNSALGLWLSSGSEAYGSGETVYPASAAITTVTNGSTWDKGLVFGVNSLTPHAATGTMKAIQLPAKGEIQWTYNNVVDARSSFIRCDATGPAFGIVVDNTSLDIRSPDETLNLFQVTTAGDTNTVGKASASGLRISGTPTSAADLTHGLDLYNASVGLNGYGNALNLNVPTGGNFDFQINSGSIGYIDATGINYLAIGQTGARAGAFSTIALNTATTGPTIRAGTGAATGTQPKGSLWLRTDGAAGSTLYVTQGGGTWAAVAGV